MEKFFPQMTWNSTMSSGYSSLEEDSEEYFFTARTSFFKKPSGKITEKKVKIKNTHTQTHTLSTHTPCKLLFFIEKLICGREALKSSCLIQIWASFRTALKKSLKSTFPLFLRDAHMKKKINKRIFHVLRSFP